MREAFFRDCCVLLEPKFGKKNSFRDGNLLFKFHYKILASFEFPPRNMLSPGLEQIQTLKGGSDNFPT